VANAELKKALNEHVTTIESLRSEKSELQSSFQSMKTDHDRVVKENTILRRAVTIQQERHTNAENELKVTRKQQTDAQERIRSLEQVILSLRYHLQTQQNHHESDFLQNRSPDVF
jgi:chromosome segregation ATPase